MRQVSYLYFMFALLALHSAFSATQTSLDRYQWQNRILLVHVSDDAQSEKLKHAAMKQKSDFFDRKLIVFFLANEQLSCLFTPCPDTEPSEFKRFSLPRGKMLLVGLDGGAKQGYWAQVEAFKQVFIDIDGMPMRKAELKTQDAGLGRKKPN